MLLYCNNVKPTRSKLKPYLISTLVPKPFAPKQKVMIIINNILSIDSVPFDNFVNLFCFVKLIY